MRTLRNLMVAFAAVLSVALLTAGPTLAQPLAVTTPVQGGAGACWYPSWQGCPGQANDCTATLCDYSFSLDAYYCPISNVMQQVNATWGQCVQSNNGAWGTCTQTMVTCFNLISCSGCTPGEGLNFYCNNNGSTPSQYSVPNPAGTCTSG
jgi:hypothetical protein